MGFLSMELYRKMLISLPQISGKNRQPYIDRMYEVNFNVVFKSQVTMHVQYVKDTTFFFCICFQQLQFITILSFYAQKQQMSLAQRKLLTFYFYFNSNRFLRCSILNFLLRFRKTVSSVQQRVVLFSNYFFLLLFSLLYPLSVTQ